MQHGRKVGRLTVLQGWLELNLLGRTNGRFVQPMTQSLYNALDTNLSGGGKDDFQQNFAFYFQAFAFLSVNRARFESDLSGNGPDDRLLSGLGHNRSLPL